MQRLRRRACSRSCRRARPTTTCCCTGRSTICRGRPAGLMRQYGMHENAWLTESSDRHAWPLKLLDAGYSLRFHLRRAARAARSRATARCVAPGGRYRGAAWCRRRAACPSRRSTGCSSCEASGRTVVVRSLAQDVPGFGKLEARRARVAGDARRSPHCAAAAGRRGYATLAQASRAARAGGRGRSCVHAPRARRRPRLLLREPRATAFDGWLRLATPAEAALLLDPLTGRRARRPLKHRRRRHVRASIYSSRAANR